MLINVLKGGVLLLFALWGSTGLADAPKFGYVNSVKLIKEAPQAQEATNRMLKEFQTRRNEILEAKDKLDFDESRFIKESSEMSAGLRSRKEREFIQRRRDLERMEIEFNEDVAKRRSAEMEKVQEILRETIQAYGKENGYDFIFFEGVSYVRPTFEITDEIVKRLSKAKR